MNVLPQTQSKARLVMTWLKHAQHTLLAFAALLPMIANAIEEPAYSVVESWDESAIEIRHYEPRVLAVTEMNAGGNSGFRVLAGYIFGGNAAEQEIAMTAPVQSTMPGVNGAQMAFVLPAEYEMAELPAPDDARVKFREEPAYDAAVIRFSGRATDTRANEHWTLLTNFLQAQQIEATGRPTLNQYNPPWTLPFMRRNEIIVPINASTVKVSAATHDAVGF